MDIKDVDEELKADFIDSDKYDSIVKKGEEELTLEEEYIAPAWTSGNTEITLGEGEYFVMGDNRNFSFDSRSWGSVESNEIVGIVRLRLWPINEVMAFEKPEY
ncbi:signal peptidase I [bacterium]|nr:signal peptidase I [bacterium]